MECLAHKEELQKTFSDVRILSFKAKKEAQYDEEKINAFLDAINDFKSMVKKQTKQLSSINERLEKLTWYNDLDEDCMMVMNDLIAAGKDLHSTLIRHYVQMANFRKKGIAKDIIKEFKLEIDDLKESYQDLESVFFFLPDFPDFKETTKLLSLV